MFSKLYPTKNLQNIQLLCLDTTGITCYKICNDDHYKVLQKIRIRLWNLKRSCETAMTMKMAVLFQDLDVPLFLQQIENAQTSLNLRDEQLQNSNCSTIVLSQPPSGRSTQRARSAFLMSSPEVKLNWALDFRAVKLAHGEHQ